MKTEFNNTETKSGIIIKEYNKSGVIRFERVFKYSFLESRKIHSQIIHKSKRNEIDIKTQPRIFWPHF